MMLIAGFIILVIGLVLTYALVEPLYLLITFIGCALIITGLIIDENKTNRERIELCASRNGDWVGRADHFLVDADSTVYVYENGTCVVPSGPS